MTSKRKCILSKTIRRLIGSSSDDRAFELAIDNSSDMCLIVNLDGVVVYANKSYLRTMLTKKDFIIGRPLKDTQGDIGDINDLILTLKEHEGELSYNKTNRKADGSVFNEITRSFLIDDKVFILSRNEMEDRQREVHLIKAAKRDKLTNALNRNAFEEITSDAFKLRDESGEDYEVGVVFIDLDDFKPINDTYGHDAGDMLLIEVVRRLKSVCDDYDSVSRLGGDEFVCTLPISKNTEELKLKVSRMLDAVNEDFKFEDFKFNVNCSIGVASYPSDGKSVDDVLKASDLAMYNSKRQGKNRITFYDHSLLEDQDEQKKLAEDLVCALKLNDVRVALMPVVNALGEPVYHDAMLRWNCPDRGEVAPIDFIEAAVEFGYMDSIYDYTLSKISSNKSIMDQLEKGISISIKIEGVDINRSDFLNYISDKIDRYGIDRSSIIVRVDEQIIASSIDKVVANINKLERFGIRVCLDDFCSGEISIFDRMNIVSTFAKLPREIVNDLIIKNRNRHILHSAISIASAMNTGIVIEGVKCMDSYNLFINSGISYLQGQYVADIIEV